jgi:formamidopyrimidine-DNA glycosylase
MPELPEVETVRRGLDAALAGRTIARVEVRRSDLRRPLPADFARRVAGRRVLGIGRRAKYLTVSLDDGTVLLAHLGMSGRMVIEPPRGPAIPPPATLLRAAHVTHAHVVFEADDGTIVRFSDPRRFGLMELVPAAALDEHPLLAHLGPEPVGNGFDGKALAARLAGKHTPIKAALLDQRVVAGLGNIYVCESLYRARLSPRRLALTVQGGRADRLAAAIRAVLAEAIAAGGSSLRDHVMPSGELGYFQHAFEVYGREGEPCPGCRCGGAVKRIVQSGRSTFYCAVRQR